MIQKIACFFLLLLVLQSCTHSQNFDKAKLNSFFAALKANDQNMGSIAISANGVLVYQNAIGYSRINKDVKTPANMETKYRFMIKSVMAIPEALMGFTIYCCICRKRK